MKSIKCKIQDLTPNIKCIKCKIQDLTPNTTDELDAVIRYSGGYRVYDHENDWPTKTLVPELKQAFIDEYIR